MKKLIKKSIAAILSAAVLTSSLVFAFPAEAASAEAPKLVSSVTHYEWSYAKNKWQKQSIETYTYKKGYPKTITEKDCFEGSKSKTSYSYTFRKNGFPKKMTAKTANGSLTVKYNSKGAVRDMVTKSELATERKSFQFAKGKTYFTMVMHNSNFYSSENPGVPDSYMQEADSVALTLKNGLLKRTVNVGLYANFNAGDSMKWERFNGTYRADYDKNGILKQTSAKFRMGPSGKQESFKVTRKNGLVTQVIRRRWMKPEGKKGYWQNEEKIVFKYTNKKISKQRYAMMINAAVIGSDNNYYLYYWY